MEVNVSLFQPLALGFRALAESGRCEPTRTCLIVPDNLKQEATPETEISDTRIQGPPVQAALRALSYPHWGSDVPSQ